MILQAEAEKNALIIKLKHARRQVDLEIKQRQKAEQDRDELVKCSLMVLNKFSLCLIDFNECFHVVLSGLFCFLQSKT